MKKIVFFSLLWLSISANALADSSALLVRMSIAEYKLNYLFQIGIGETIHQRIRIKAIIDNLRDARLGVIEGDVSTKTANSLIKKANKRIEAFDGRLGWKDVDPIDDRWLKR